MPEELTHIRPSPFREEALPRTTFLDDLETLSPGSVWQRSEAIKLSFGQVAWASLNPSKDKICVYSDSADFGQWTDSTTEKNRGSESPIKRVALLTWTDQNVRLGAFVRRRLGANSFLGRVSDLPDPYHTYTDHLESAENRSTGPSAEFQPATDNRQKVGEVQFFETLLSMWGLNEEQGAVLLGYENLSEIRDLLSGVAGIRSRDAKDRLRCLFRIRAALRTLFRDIEVEREWLREEKEDLEGESPLDLLLEGSMANVLRVTEFVEYVSGV